MKKFSVIALLSLLFSLGNLAHPEIARAKKREKGPETAEVLAQVRAAIEPEQVAEQRPQSPSTWLRTNGGGAISLLISVHAEDLEAFL